MSQHDEYDDQDDMNLEFDDVEDEGFIASADSYDSFSDNDYEAHDGDKLSLNDFDDGSRNDYY
jgi:hypothetical protein